MSFTTPGPAAPAPTSVGLATTAAPSSPALPSPLPLEECECHPSPPHPLTTASHTGALSPPHLTVTHSPPTPSHPHLTLTTAHPYTLTLSLHPLTCIPSHLIISLYHSHPHCSTPSLPHTLTAAPPHTLTAAPPHSLTAAPPHCSIPSLPHTLTAAPPHSLTLSPLHIYMYYHYVICAPTHHTLPSPSPLQMLAAEAPLEPSFQPSLSNCLSFSAFHDSQDGSSLAPFHDSWVGRRAERHAPLASSAPSMEDSSLSSSALPEMPNMSPSEQSFTQFGIPHPANDFGPSSTPRHFRSAGALQAHRGHGGRGPGGVVV